MKPISFNLEIGDRPRLLCPGALQGPAKYQCDGLNKICLSEVLTLLPKLWLSAPMPNKHGDRVMEEEERVTLLFYQATGKHSSSALRAVISSLASRERLYSQAAVSDKD